MADSGRIVFGGGTTGLAFVPEVRGFSADSDSTVTLPADGSWVDIPCVNVYAGPDGVSVANGDEVSIAGDSLLTALYISLFGISGNIAVRAGFPGAETDYINVTLAAAGGTTVIRSRGAASSIQNYIPLPHRSGRLLFQLSSNSAAQETVSFAELGFERLLALP